MKDDINLLPPVVQKKRVGRIYERRVNYIYRMGLGGLILVLLAYGVLTWMEYQRQGVLTEQMENTPIADESVREEIADINVLLGSVDRWVNARSFWTKDVASVLSGLPAEVTVQQVSLQNDPERLVVEGVAGSRGSVVEYERRLRELPWVEDIEAPLRNFAGGSLIEYSMTIFRSPKL